VPATALVLGSVLSVQVGSALARRLFHVAGPTGITLLRLVLAAALLGVLVRPRPGAVSAAARLPILVFGVTFAGMNLTFYEAISRLPLGVTVTIEFLGPLAVAVAGARRWLHLLWCACAAGGVALLSQGGGKLSALGLLFAALAGVGWATYILTSRRVGQLVPGAAGLALALPIAAVLLLPFGAGALVHGLSRDPALLAGGLAVAALSSAIPYTLELAALRRLPPATFGVLMSLEPAVAALAGWLLLSQHLDFRQIAAIALVCVASGGVTVTGRGQAPPPRD
jgi:inner membrane transporter RhtA